MLVAGLTGGIGAGKSTLAALLAERGAQIIDADVLGRDALRPGQPAWHAVVSQFGEEILVSACMEIDRQRLADIVFGERNKLAALNAIVHPVIFGAIAEALERLIESDAVVVIDAAVIVEAGMEGDLDALVVVVADEAARRDRLAASRGMDRDDIAARMASQASDEEKIAKAHIVVRNEGSLDQLASEADRVWSELIKRRDNKKREDES